MKIGAVLLCGGHSQRMGYPKALLPFGAETLLQRVLRRLEPISGPRVVVASADQKLPSLPQDVLVTRDQRQGHGPIEGIRAGLQALVHRADAAYVCGCDAPFLKIALVRQLIRRLTGVQIVVPVDGPHFHPLSAVYRLSVLPYLEDLIAEGCRRPALLFDRVPTCRLPVAELRCVDAELASLVNVNHPEDYVSALGRAGLGIPADFFLPENVSE